MRFKLVQKQKFLELLTAKILRYERMRRQNLTNNKNKIFRHIDETKHMKFFFWKNIDAYFDFPYFQNKNLQILFSFINRFLSAKNILITQWTMMNNTSYLASLTPQVVLYLINQSLVLISQFKVCNSQLNTFQNMVKDQIKYPYMSHHVSKHAIHVVECAVYFLPILVL